MKRLSMVLLTLIAALQLTGCRDQGSAENINSQNSSSMMEASLNESTSKEVVFSYLEQLTLDKQEVFELFRTERDLELLSDFTPEDMVIVYLHCSSINDPDLLYAITYNGGMLPDQETFRNEYFEYALTDSSDTAVRYRYYDSIEAEPETTEDDTRTVHVTVSVGTITNSMALGLQKEDNIWKLDIYHLIEDYKKQAK